MLICQLQGIPAAPQQLVSNRLPGTGTLARQDKCWSLIKEEVAMPVRISKKIRRYFWLMPVIDRANSVYDIAGRQKEAPVVQQTL